MPAVNYSGLVMTSKTQCYGVNQTTCAFGEVLNNVTSKLCITIATCKASYGSDGYLRVIALNGLYCMNAGICTSTDVNSASGVIINNVCMCGSSTYYWFPFYATQMKCVSNTTYVPFTDLQTVACPYNTYLNFSKICTPCPTTGCNAS